MTKIKDGQVFDGLELGPVDERARDHAGVPGLLEAVRARLERDRAGRVKDSAEPPNTAMRDFLQESGDAVPVADAVEEGDLGQEVTLVKFRRRHGLPPNAVLTPALVAQAINERKQGLRARAAGVAADPFDL